MVADITIYITHQITVKDIKKQCNATLKQPFRLSLSLSLFTKEK